MRKCETDYRMGRRPSSRRMKCQTEIRKALKEGKQTFGSLLRVTHVSRSTLAFHLKEMYNTTPLLSRGAFLLLLIKILLGKSARERR